MARPTQKQKNECTYDFASEETLKACAGHYWFSKDTDAYIAVSPKKQITSFVYWDDNEPNKKLIRACAKLWTKGKCSLAHKLEEFSDSLYYSDCENYEDLLTKELSGIITKNELYWLKRWRSWKKKANI